MRLYEINFEIYQLLSEVDEETGELTEETISKLAELSIARDEKHENIALLIKNLTAEATALKTEADALTQRQRVAKNKIERLKNYLADSLQGETLETPRTKITWRRSTSVRILDEYKIPQKYLIPQDAKISRSEIAKDLKAGHEVTGAELQENQNIQIK